MSEPTAWSHLPTQLQLKFFAQAEEESKKCKARLLVQAERIKAFMRNIRFEAVPKDTSWKDWKIACVDGSYSPATSERMGVRYGVCAAGCLIFKGDTLVAEKYNSDSISHEQVGDPEVTGQILSLLSTKHERDLALDCLENEKVDLLLIDGALFGFRAFSINRNEGIDAGGFSNVGKLVDYIRDASVQIMNSGKAVGIVKRVRTNAFDGWLIEHADCTDQCLERNDRAVLASVMPKNHWFAYEWLFGDPVKYNYYTRLRTTFEKYGSKGGMPLVQERTRELVESDTKRSLGLPSDEILRTSRYYLRCAESAPPFCFETLVGTDVKPILAYFKANHNPATGLPFPLDLVDENVSLPENLTKEFVEEVEALLIKDRELDKFDLSNHFLSINPQKEE